MEYIVLFIGVGLLLTVPLVIEMLEDLGIIKPKEISEEELRKLWEELCANNKEEKL